MSIGANAAPVAFTFTGTVSSISDYAGIIDGSFGVGAEVEYVFTIDFAEDGFRTRYGGDVVTTSDDSTNGYDFIYTDLVSGGLISGVSSDMTTSSYTEEYNFGYDNNPNYFRYIYGGSDSEHTRIESHCCTENYFSDAEIGDSFTGFEQAGTGSASVSFIYSDLTLTSVSAVPLPAAAWLFISAIAGLAGAKRLSRSKGSA